MTNYEILTLDPKLLTCHGAVRYGRFSFVPEPYLFKPQGI